MARCLNSAGLVATSLLFAGCAGMQQSTAELAMFYRDHAGPAAGRPTARMRLSADGVIRVTPDSACADFPKQETGVALFVVARVSEPPAVVPTCEAKLCGR